MLTACPLRHTPRRLPVAVASIRSVVLAGLCFAVGVGNVHAFDTGHHSDLTREALIEAGFAPDAIRAAQVLNWLTDYYSNQPGAGLEAELAKLHFDNLADYDAVARYWSHLVANTRAEVQSAASDDDPLRLLAVLGISLHVVQDFYTHSNWPERFPRASGDPFRSETWFSGSSVGADHRTEDGCLSR